MKVMSKVRPEGTPSRVTTSAWPCDSPAVRNLSILTGILYEETARFWRVYARWPGEVPPSRRLQRQRGVSSSRATPFRTSDVCGSLPAVDQAEALSRRGRHAAAERALRQVAGALVRRRAYVPASAALIRLGRLLVERGRTAAACRAF